MSEPELDIYIQTGIRTSRGPGPGQFRLPASEAQRIQANRLGVIGTRAARGYSDGGADQATVTASRVYTDHSPRPESNVGASN